MQKHAAPADLRALRKALTRAESLSTLQTASKPNRPMSAAPRLTTSPWLLAQPPRADDAAALQRWVERRLGPFNGADAEPDGAFHAATDWDTPEVLTWLRCSVGLEQYGHAFAAQGVRGAALLTLDETDLLSMGIRSLGHRKRILQACEELRQRLPSLPAALASGAGADHIGKQRRHVAALSECMQKVMAHCHDMPLHSRQMLQQLWDAQQRISLESLAEMEAQRAALKRREAEQLPRRQARVRASLEPLMRAQAQAEDRAVELARQLREAIEYAEGMHHLEWEHKATLLQVGADSATPTADDPSTPTPTPPHPPHAWPSTLHAPLCRRASQLEALKTTHEDLEEQREQTLSLRRALLDKSSAEHADEARAMLERLHAVGAELTEMIDERERVSNATTPDGGSFRDGSAPASNYGGSFRSAYSAREDSSSFKSLGAGTGAGGRR